MKNHVPTLFVRKGYLRVKGNITSDHYFYYTFLGI